MVTGSTEPSPSCTKHQIVHLPGVGWKNVPLVLGTFSTNKTGTPITDTSRTKRRKRSSRSPFVTDFWFLSVPLPSPVLRLRVLELGPPYVCQMHQDPGPTSDLTTTLNVYPVNTSQTQTGLTPGLRSYPSKDNSSSFRSGREGGTLGRSEIVPCPSTQPTGNEGSTPV